MKRNRKMNKGMKMNRRMILKGLREWIKERSYYSRNTVVSVLKPLGNNISQDQYSTMPSSRIV